MDSLTAQKRLVESGFGVALLPRSSFREELERGSLRIVDVEQLRVEQPVFAVRRKNSKNPLLPEFIALLKQTTPELLGTRKRRKPRVSS